MTERESQPGQSGQHASEAPEPTPLVGEADPVEPGTETTPDALRSARERPTGAVETVPDAGRQPRVDAQQPDDIAQVRREADTGDDESSGSASQSAGPGRVTET